MISSRKLFNLFSFIFGKKSFSPEIFFSSKIFFHLQRNFSTFTFLCIGFARLIATKEEMMFKETGLPMLNQEPEWTHRIYINAKSFSVHPHVEFLRAQGSQSGVSVWQLLW